MIKYNFWESWKNKTSREKRAINSVKRVREMIFNSIPKSELVAIYIKGSFVRREMKSGSDVDVVPIVTENKYESPVFDTNVPEVSPCVIVPLSLWEFKYNKLFAKAENKPDTRAKPDRFLKRLNFFKLIYGKSINPKNFKMRSDRRAHSDHLKYLKNVLIPMYDKGTAGVNWIAKEFFWFIEDELELNGIKVKHSFSGIANAVKDREHPIKLAYKLRIKSTENLKLEKDFIKRLKQYLNY